MRSLLAMSLFALALAVPVARASKTPAPPQPARDRLDSIRTEEVPLGWKLTEGNNWRYVATGYGETQANAEHQAQTEAYKAVLKFLRRRLPELTWEPSLDYLIRLKVIPANGTLVSSDVGQKDDPGGLKKVELKVEISPSDVEEILRQDRLFRTQERHWTWAKLLGGSVGLLLIVAGYYRLEEMTKGYYTTRLRVAAVCCSLLVSAVVVLLLVIG